MKPLVLTALTLALATTSAAAQGNGSTFVVEDRTAILVGCGSCYHCPEHAHHCGFFEWVRGNFSLNTSVSVRANGSQLPVPASLSTDASAELVLNFSQSGADANATHVLQVEVFPALGVNLTGTATQNVTLGPGGASASFPFQVARVWSAGDIIFLAYALSEAGETSGSFAPIRVAEPPAEPRGAPLGPVALAALVVAALALAARRKL